MDRSSTGSTLSREQRQISADRTLLLSAERRLVSLLLLHVLERLSVLGLAELLVGLVGLLLRFVGLLLRVLVINRSTYGLSLLIYDLSSLDPLLWESGRKEDVFKSLVEEVLPTRRLTLSVMSRSLQGGGRRGRRILSSSGSVTSPLRGSRIGGVPCHLTFVSLDPLEAFHDLPERVEGGPTGS